MGIITIWVDDLMLFTSSDKIMNHMKNTIKSEWEATDLGEPKKIVGIEITLTDKSITILQEKYIERILEREGMCYNRTRTRPTPIPPISDLRHILHMVRLISNIQSIQSFSITTESGQDQLRYLRCRTSDIVPYMFHLIPKIQSIRFFNVTSILVSYILTFIVFSSTRALQQYLSSYNSTVLLHSEYQLSFCLSFSFRLSFSTQVSNLAPD